MATTRLKKVPVKHFFVSPALVIFLSALLRMLGLGRPLLGHFSMYQTANAMMARFFIENHFATLLYPQVNVLANGKPGLLLLAYPINALIAACLKVSLGGSLDFWGRFQSVLFFTGASLYLYRLVTRWVDSSTAFVSLLIFSLSPLTLIYGQSFQNEMATVFFSITFLFYWDLFLKEMKNTMACVLSALSFACVLLTRPNALYLVLPAGYLLFKEIIVPGKLKSFVLKLTLFSGVAAGIPILWFGHLWKVSQVATHIYSTVFTQVEVRSSFLSPLIFSLSYYQELFDKLSGMTLTPIGFAFLIMGSFLAVQDWKRYGVILLWGAAFLLSSLLIPRKLIDHDFYLLHLLPPAAPVMAVAVLTLMKGFRDRPGLQRVFGITLILLSFAFSMRYALHPAFKTTEEDRFVLEIADQLNRVTDKSSKIIVQGSHPVLYYADRYGWTFALPRSGQVSDYYTAGNWEKMPEDQRQRRNEALKDPIAELEYRRQYEGATHFIVMNPKTFYSVPVFASYMHEHFKTVYEKKNVTLIFELAGQS